MGRVRAVPRMRRAVTTVELAIGSVLLTLVLGGTWALTSFGGRSTSAAMLQAECLRHANIAHRRLTRELASVERILLPSPGTTSGSTLVVQEWSGAVKVVTLSPSRECLMIRRTGTKGGALLADLRSERISFSHVGFRNVDGELGVTMSFVGRDGEPLSFFNSIFAGFRRESVY